MKTTWALLGSMTMAAVLTGNTVGHAALTPTETVNSAVASLMNILKDPVFLQPGMSESRRLAIENVVRSNVSYEHMARRTMGMAWMALSGTEQQHFQRSLSTGVARCGGLPHE